MMRERYMLQNSLPSTDGMLHNVISNWLNEKQSLDEIVLHYEQYVVFIPQGTIYFILLLSRNLIACKKISAAVKVYVEKRCPKSLRNIYKNSTTLFLQNSSDFVKTYIIFLKNVHLSGQKVSLEIQVLTIPLSKNLLSDNTDVSVANT